MVAARGSLLPVRSEGIPEELKVCSQWVNWRLEKRRDEWTKVPYTPGVERKASSNDPLTWGSFNKGLTALHTGRYDGIGFVFMKDDPFCGVDLDGCRDPETGEIEPWAQDIVQELHSYTEISPSGTGLHILVRGELPDGRNRKGRVEMYDHGRYFTLTGRHLEGTPRTIEVRQEQLIALRRRVLGEPPSTNGQKTPRPQTDNGLSDQEIIAKASEADNGEKFRRLWNGDTSDYASASEADLALCSIIASYAGPDRERIDTLFRQSGLYREKWERTDYRNRTISKALDGRTEFHNASRAAPLKESNNKDNTSNTIFKELPVAQPFPVDALPVACRRFVREAADAIGCPPELIAVPLLATLSAGIGASRVVQLKAGWRESTALYMATVSPPGLKKTPAVKAATAPAWRKQAQLRQKYRNEREIYEAEYRHWETDKRRAAQNEESSPEPPDEPTMGRSIVEDTTVEALANILESNPRGVLDAYDELSGWARAMNQYKSKGADRQFWLSTWSNSPHSVDRKGRAEPIIIPMPLVSVVGGIQPSILPELTERHEDGLLDRFLWSYPEPYRSRLTDDEISTEATADYMDLYDKLFALEMRASENGEMLPEVVSLSPDAWVVFKELSDQLQDEAHTPGFPARLQGVWSKMEAYLVRLSLILAICRVAEQGGEEQVEARDVLMASALVDYFKAHARRVHAGLHGQNADDLLAKDLAEFLREHGGEWNDEPSVLHEKLKSRGSEAVPSRADELSKMVYAISDQGTWLKAEPGWKKNQEGKSRRAIHLHSRNGVDGVVGVDQQAE